MKEMDIIWVVLCLTVLAFTPAETLGITPRITASEPLVVAHRGASEDAPENTLPAFKLAWEQGADAIEGDFYFTKDKAIVCIHDCDTKKTAGVDKKIADTTLEELRRLDVGLWKGEKWKGTKIPTIAEVFATVPEGGKIYVEVKIGTEIIPALLKEIERSGLADEQVVIIAFDKDVIRGMKDKAPQFKAFWLSSVKKDESGELTPTLDSVLETLKKISADGLSSNRKAINQAFIQDVMAAGYEYHVWTVNDLETAMRFRNWGARSITTNVPERIKPCKSGL